MSISSVDSETTPNLRSVHTEAHFVQESGHEMEEHTLGLAGVSQGRGFRARGQTTAAPSVRSKWHDLVFYNNLIIYLW